MLAPLKMDSRFDRTDLPLKENHEWRATPGYRIAALDRGAIRFEFPNQWICLPDQDSVKFYDKEPPSDNCRLAVSRQGLPEGANRIPLDALVARAAKEDACGLRRIGEVIHVRRPSRELAWLEFRFTDPDLSHEARSRFCFARGAGLYALVTFEFWQDDSERFIPVWDHVMDTLTLGEFILDPTSGSRLQRNHPQTG
jgi:hypothetical protein